MGLKSGANGWPEAELSTNRKRELPQSKEGN